MRHDETVLDTRAALRMHYVGYAELAAAVSNAGGLGTARRDWSFPHMSEAMSHYIVILVHFSM